MRVPDDVIMLCVMDNWEMYAACQMAKERKHPGGFGTCITM
jgi:hypothetical protein